MLAAYLDRRDVKKLMMSFGYGDLELEEILDPHRGRLSGAHGRKKGLPLIEIGLVLGYPPVDVEGFIKKEGRDFLYSGYWKVYGNLEDTLKHSKCMTGRDYVISMTGNGNEIRDILAASSSTAGSNNKKKRWTARSGLPQNKFQEEIKMDKVIVAYWSQTGNTAAMAAAIGEGITEAGKEAVVTDISSVSMDDLQAASAFALGCPAMELRFLRKARWSRL